VNSNKSLTTALRKEIREHNKLRMENVEDRRAYLQQKMEDLNNRFQCKTTIKELTRREQDMNDFAIIKRVLKPKKSEGIRYLDIPDDTNKDIWIRVKDQCIIEEKILKRNKVHFGQDCNTPFANNKLTKIFGYKGIHNYVDNLIDNGLMPPAINQENEYAQNY
jgi:hypothetical protein